MSSSLRRGAVWSRRRRRNGLVPSLLLGLVACCVAGGCRKRIPSETGLAIRSASSQTMALSPDGSQLVSAANDGTVDIFDAATGQLKVRVGKQGPDQMAGFGDSASSIAFDPNGKNVLLGYYDGFIALVNLQTGAVVRRAKAHNDHVILLAMAANRQYLVSTCYSPGPDKLKLWSMADGHLVWSIPFSAAYATGLAIAPDGRQVAFCDGSGLLAMAQLNSRRVTILTKGGSKPFSPLTKLAFAPDGKTFAAGDFAGDVQLWDAARGLVLQTWKPAEKAWTGVSDLCFSADGQSLAIAEASRPEATVQIRSVKDGAVLSSMTAGQSGMKLAFAAARQVRFAGSGTTAPLRVWNMTF